MATVSANEGAFVQEALAEGVRTDGRTAFDFRRAIITCASCRAVDGSVAAATATSGGQPRGRVEVQLGRTRILAAVSAEMVEPFPDRPAEGFFKLNIEFSPMASPSFEPHSRDGEDCVEIARVVERGITESKAVDTESLCIASGVKVWQVRVDLHVLDHDGNIIDCAALAAIGALLDFRVPEVSVEHGGMDDGSGAGGDQAVITIHSAEDREPVPLSIHHIPICISFALFEDDLMVVDPNFKEESVMQGRITFTFNPHQEICSIHKSGGLAVTAQEILRCAHIAAVKASELHVEVQGALDAAEKRYLQLRSRRDRRFEHDRSGLNTSNRP